MEQENNNFNDNNEIQQKYNLINVKDIQLFHEEF